MPFGTLPTSGGGLRCWQIYQGLKSNGVEVIASMPAFTFLTQKYFDQIPEDVKSYLWEWHTQDEILSRVKPDAVIFSSNWDHYNLTNKPNIPLIIDLHGSRLIETSLFGNPQDPNKKVEIFSKADCLLTAGLRQRNYFYGWLTQAGRVPVGDHFIKYIPVSVSPDDFKRNDSANDLPIFVSGGGWFPWQDQSKAIFRIAESVTKNQKGEFKIFGTPHNQDIISKEEQEIRTIFDKISEVSKKEERIKVVGYVGRDSLLEEYKTATVAVELMKKNLERELAFTTRTIEYLWCGLPVIYNNYSEISDHIKEYDAGWTLDPENPDQLDLCLNEIFSNPELVKIKSDNAKKLVRDRFSYNKTIKPLIEFLENPKISKQSKPAKGHIFVSAPYLNPTDGKNTKIKIEDGNSFNIVQDFIFPQEGIWAVELPYLISCNKLDFTSTTTFKISIKNSLGIVIAKKSGSLTDLVNSDLINTEEVQNRGSFLLIISKILRPRGGAKAKLVIRLNGSSSTSFSFPGLEKEIFPLSKLIINNKQVLSCLAISFYPGFGRLYYLINKVERAFFMIKRGEYNRIIRAFKKRALPKLKYLVKRS